MAMPLYTVEQGDCLSSIACTAGLVDWKKIYNDPNNASFRELRSNPNVIYPGDQLYIPDRDPGEESRPTDQTHTFKLNRQSVFLRLVLLDEMHKPLAGVAYTLTIDGTPTQGTAGSDGLVEKSIQPTAKEANISIKLPQEQDTGYTWNLRLGGLDPETTMTGVQARLNNLGYNTGPVDGIQGRRTTEAIKEFQSKYSLKADGIVGPITRSKLVEVHGC
jgi:N-acetylmuramoyl-L-alanine amidase